MRVCTPFTLNAITVQISITSIICANELAHQVLQNVICTYVTSLTTTGVQIIFIIRFYWQPILTKPNLWTELTQLAAFSPYLAYWLPPHLAFLEGKWLYWQPILT
jgi:hypothetical protein